MKGCRRKDKQVRTMHRPSRRSNVFIVIYKSRLRCKAAQWFRRKEKQVRTMHRHTAEEVLLCCRGEGSGAKHCSAFEGKISKSELCTGTAAEILYLLCLKRQIMVGTVFKKAQSSKEWPKLERQRRFLELKWLKAEREHF